MSDRKRIHLCLPKMSENGVEQKYIQEAFDSNWVAPLGANVDGFEEDLKRFLGGEREVLCLSSGTAAVHLALLLAGVGPGDEVLVQSFTFCASANPVIYLGATPVFVDSEKDTWNMDPDLLEKAIRDRIAVTGKAPKAIVPVSLYGMPYQMDRILAIASKYGITVVEDSAESLGSRYRGKNLGTFGRFGVLSFNGNKMITTSGGGALICPDAAMKKKALCYATQAREALPFYQHNIIVFPIFAQASAAVRCMCSTRISPITRGFRNFTKSCSQVCRACAFIHSRRMEFLTPITGFAQLRWILR